MTISPATKLFAVVGDPVAHSLSPLIHNRWIAEAGIDAVYAALHLRSDAASADLAALGRAGFAGLNITLPHKTAALQASARQSPEASLIGAANTLARENDGEWRAHNTDLEGFSYALAHVAGDNLAGKPIVLIGAGGAARAAVVHLAAQGADLAIVNRSRERAEALASDLAPTASVGELSDLSHLAANAFAIVNSASLGHAGEALPSLPAGRGRAFLDMSYGKAAAAAMSAARDAGWSPSDGLRMLVGQAAAAFRIWFGVSPDVAGALEVCRAAVEARA
jgi:shikimate dehydrogenase